MKITTRRKRYSQQLVRAIAIAEAVRGKRLSLSELTEIVVARTGQDVCQRTIRRDAYALAELGYLTLEARRYCGVQATRAAQTA